MGCWLISPSSSLDPGLWLTSAGEIKTDSPFSSCLDPYLHTLTSGDRHMQSASTRTPTLVSYSWDFATQCKMHALRECGKTSTSYSLRLWSRVPCCASRSYPSTIPSVPPSAFLSKISRLWRAPSSLVRCSSATPSSRGRENLLRPSPSGRRRDYWTTSSRPTGSSRLSKLGYAPRAHHRTSLPRVRRSLPPHYGRTSSIFQTTRRLRRRTTALPTTSTLGQI